MNSTRLRELRELAERIRINQREKRRENLEKVNLRRAAAEIRRRRAADASQNAFHPDASGSYDQPVNYDEPVSYDQPVNYDEPASYKPASYDEPVSYKPVNYDEPFSYKPVSYKPVSYKPYDINGPRDIEEERRRFNKLMGRQDPLAEMAYWQQEESDDSDDMPPKYHVPPIQNKAFRHALPTPHSIKWWNAYRDPDWDPETAHVIPQEQIRPLSPQPETPSKPDFDWNLTNNPDSILASTPLVAKHDIEEPQTPEQSPVSEESQNPPLTPTLSPIEIAPPAEGEDPNADPPDETRDVLRALSRKLAKTSSPIIYDEDWDPVQHRPKEATKHGPSTDDKHGPSTDDKHGPSTDDKHGSSTDHVPNQPTNSGRAEEAREQEALQLRSMNSRLHAASRSIRDAYRNARQLVDSVDTAELMGHKCKACETCGHVEQHPIVMICTGIKRLLISSDNSHGRTNLTWFGLIFMILSLWYMTEIAVSEFFGTTDYASTMHGYGVFPDSPRYPFALLTLISWIPPFSWLTPLFKANMFYEATKTVQGF